MWRLLLGFLVTSKSFRLFASCCCRSHLCHPSLGFVGDHQTQTHTNSECVVACCPKQTHAVERRVVLQFMLRFSRLIARLSFPGFDVKQNILLDDVVNWKKKDSYAVALKNFAYNELRTAPCAHAQMIGRRNVESENSFTSQWRQLSTVTAPTILLQFPVDATVLTMEPQNKLVE